MKETTERYHINKLARFEELSLNQVAVGLKMKTKRCWERLLLRTPSGIFDGCIMVGLVSSV